ncbi:MAG: hypothetical protein QM733_01235 [Ilumatobacteraceae bacterium]
MPDSDTIAPLRPPGVQPALFHVPCAGPPTYTVFDRDGRPHTHTASLGVAATAARFLVAEHGEAWVRSADDTTARITPTGVTSDRPDHPWVTTLTATMETTR